nr:MAG TPA: hypothetical protein [Siphoviridae sp. ctgbm9]
MLYRVRISYVLTTLNKTTVYIQHRPYPYLRGRCFFFIRTLLKQRDKRHTPSDARLKVRQMLSYPIRLFQLL